MPAITKYLDRYAEPESQLVHNFPARFDSVLVLPSFDERWSSCAALLQHNFENSALIILVLNQPQNISDCTRNRQVHHSLRTQFDEIWSAGNDQLVLFQKNNCSVLMVDRHSTGHRIPRSQGVGLARKIGADIALSLIQQGSVRNPWIHNIDADSSLPTPYVTLCKNQQPDTAAIILPFQHLAGEHPALNLAQAIYDRHMHYYVAALRWAGSPYAHHSLGSTLILSAKHYALVRGFPKRSAGEDFHLLNKLRKVGTVVSLPEPTVKLRIRASQRTPFGTGTAVSEISELQHPERDYRFYHPRIFSELKAFLALLPELQSEKKRALAALPTHTQQVLHALGIDQAVRHASSNSTSSAAFTKHMHTWFDALKTLQFVHALRDGTYASVSAKELDQLLPAGLSA